MLRLTAKATLRLLSIIPIVFKFCATATAHIITPSAAKEQAPANSIKRRAILLPFHSNTIPSLGLLLDADGTRSCSLRQSGNGFGGILLLLDSGGCGSRCASFALQIAVLGAHDRLRLYTNKCVKAMNRKSGNSDRVCSMHLPSQLPLAPPRRSSPESSPCSPCRA